MSSNLFKNSYHQIQRFAAKYWLICQPVKKIIGVTGSYGKTYTTLAISAILRQKYRLLQTDINLDTLFNIPLTLLKSRPSDQVLVLEYGVDHKNEMDLHLNLVRPNIAVLTGITATHSDQGLLGSLEGIIKEKTKLISCLKPNENAVLNYDDLYVRDLASKTVANVIWYGLNKNPNYWAEGIKTSLGGTVFELYTKSNHITCSTKLIGKHLVQDCLAATAVARLLGCSWDQVRRGLAELKPLEGRMSLEKINKQFLVINDSLRANPASTAGGLQTIHDLPHNGRKIIVIGPMGELGDSAKAEHQKIGVLIATLKPDYLITIGELPQIIAQTAIKNHYPSSQIKITANVIEAADTLHQLLQPSDLLYLKGSRLKHLERIILILKGEKVGCRVASCHFYYHCRSCPYLKSGVQS